MNVPEFPTTDLAEKFKELNSEALKFTNKKFQELRKSKYSASRGPERIIAWMRFHFTTIVIVVFAFFLITSLAVISFGTNSSSFIQLSFALFMLLLVLFILCLILVNLFYSYPSNAYFIQVRCQKLVQLAEENGISIEDLKKGAEISVEISSWYRQLIIAAIALFPLYATLERVFLDIDTQLLSQFFARTFGGPPLSSELALLIVFVLYLSLFFVRVEIPYRSYLAMKFCLEKEIYVME